MGIQNLSELGCLWSLGTLWDGNVFSHARQQHLSCSTQQQASELHNLAERFSEVNSATTFMFSVRNQSVRSGVGGSVSRFRVRAQRLGEVFHNSNNEENDTYTNPKKAFSHQGHRWWIPMPVGKQHHSFSCIALSPDEYAYSIPHPYATLVP